MRNTANKSIGEPVVEPVSGLTYRRRSGSEDTFTKSRLLLLHGVGGNETNLSALAASLDARIEVVLVRGPLQFARDQYGWFEVDFLTSGPTINEPQANKSRLQLITLIQTLSKQDGSAPSRTVIAGFSQGGILSASVGLSAPSDVAGFAILSGRILPELEGHIGSMEQLSKLSAFVAHGRFDKKLPIVWAERSERWLAKLGVSSQIKHYPVGHEINADVIVDFTQWLTELFALT